MSEEFVIRFGPPEGDVYPVYVGEEQVGAFHPPVTGAPLAELSDVEEAVIQAWGVSTPGERGVLVGILNKLAARLGATGQALYQALFAAHPALGEHLASLPVDTRLVLEFDPQAQALLSLPWEYLTAPDSTRLAALHPLARRLVLGGPHPSPCPLPSPAGRERGGGRGEG